MSQGTMTNVVTISDWVGDDVRTTNSVTVETTPGVGTAEKVTNESRVKTMAYVWDEDPIIGTMVLDLSLYAANWEPIAAMDSAEIGKECSLRTCLTICTA